MKEDASKHKWLVRSQNWLYILLILLVAGLLAWLSTRYEFEADWTANNRNSLSEPSRKLISRLEKPLSITAFASGRGALRNRIRDFISQYQRFAPGIEFKFVNPDKVPAKVRSLGITVPGTLVVRYAGGHELVTRLNEQALTNAIARLARQGESVITFVTGHGERDPTGRANFDLGHFSQQLQNIGIDTRTLNLTKNPDQLKRVEVLVIAGPEVAYLPGEVQLIKNYIEKGGNLLWLAEPGESRYGLKPLAEALGIDFLPGVVVDPTTRLFGIQDPAYALVVDYPPHEMLRGLQALTLYPRAAAMEFTETDGWNITPILTTLARTWTETGKISGTIRFNENSNETPGPLRIGLAMSRTLGGDAPKQASDESGQSTREQRIVVIGDGDFLSNAYIGNGANLALGTRIVNWLIGADRFIEIAPEIAPDTGLKLSKVESVAIALGSMIVLPVILVLIGATVWWRRRRR